MIILDGIRTISKKNSKKLIRVRGRVIIVSSTAYTKFEKEALGQIARQKPCKYKGNINIDYVFQMKGRLDSDLSNMIASIEDVLQKAGVIEDDKLVISTSALKEGGYDNFRTLIDIQPVFGR